MFESRYVKGVPFLSRRCMKGVTFLSKMVYKRGRGPRGEAYPYNSLVITPQGSSVFTNSGIRAYRRSKPNNSNHYSRAYSGCTNDHHNSLQNRRLISQARRTRHFARAKRETRGGEKKAPVASPLFWLFPRPLSERCVTDALFWHFCLEQNNRRGIHVLLTMLFDEKPFVYFQMFQK